jgi:peroxiredoxin
VIEQFDDFEALDQYGDTRSLSELVGSNPSVLTTYRGAWCPKDDRFFRRLVEFQDEVDVAYTSLISLSVDPPEVAAALRDGLGARWTFLCDPDRILLERFKLLEVTDTYHRPYLPAVFVLRPDLSVYKHYNGYWFWGRPTLCELVSDLRAVSAEVRPDWEPPRA